MRTCLAFVVIAFVALSVSGPARAQWDPSATAMLGAGYGQLALSQAVLSAARSDSAGTSKPGTRKRATPKKAPRPKRASARQLRALRFAPDAAVTAGETPRLAEVLVASCPPDRTGCPTNHADLIAEHLPDGGFREGFADNVERLLRGSRRNLADAVAGFVVLVWQAQRASAGTPDRLSDAETAGARRFLRETRHALALNRQIRGLPDADKQRVAETLAVVAQHGISLHRAYLDAGAGEPAADLRSYLRRVTRDWLGVDVATVRLTQRGFRTRG